MAEPSTLESNMLSRWACHICLEEARNAVCTKCGHLFCWSCLHQWVFVKGKPCSVCRALIDLSGGVPVYGSDTTIGPSDEAGSNSLPPRPHPAVIRPPPRRPRFRFLNMEPPRVDTSHVIPRFRATQRVIEAGHTEGREQLVREEEQIIQNRNSFPGEVDNLARMRQRVRELELAVDTMVLSGTQTPGASSQ